MVAKPARNAGIGEKDVEAAMLARDILDEAVHLVLAAGIGAQVGALADIDPDDRRAFAAEQVDGRFADPEARP